MSVKATSFVLKLRGLTPHEKVVGLTFAGHDSHKGLGAWPSMQTVAAEAGLANRETASRITKRLTDARVLLTDCRSKGGRGNPTVYRFNYKLENCDSRITLSTAETVTPQSRLKKETVTLGSVNCDSEAQNLPETVTQNAETVTGESHEGFKGLREREKREGKPALALSQTKTLTELVKQLAKEISKQAVFGRKVSAEIREAITLTDATKEELRRLVPARVRDMDDFELKHAGATLADELPAMIRAARAETERETREQQENDQTIERIRAEGRQQVEAESAKRKAERQSAPAEVGEI